jgi:hypothetical protein
MEKLLAARAHGQIRARTAGWPQHVKIPSSMPYRGNRPDNGGGTTVWAIQPTRIKTPVLASYHKNEPALRGKAVLNRRKQELGMRKFGFGEHFRDRSAALDQGMVSPRRVDVIGFGASTKTVFRHEKSDIPAAEEVQPRKSIPVRNCQPGLTALFYRAATIPRGRRTPENSGAHIFSISSSNPTFRQVQKVSDRAPDNPRSRNCPGTPNEQRSEL